MQRNLPKTERLAVIRRTAVGYKRSLHATVVRAAVVNIDYPIFKAHGMAAATDRGQCFPCSLRRDLQSSAAASRSALTKHVLLVRAWDDTDQHSGRRAARALSETI